MEIENNYNFDTLSSIHVNLFKFIGILPCEYIDKFSDFRNKIRMIAPRIYCHVFNTIFSTMYICYGIRMFKGNRIEVDYICELTVVHGHCFRYLILYRHRQDLQTLVRFCRDLWLFVRSNEFTIVRAFERRVYYMRTIFFFVTYTTVTVYVVPVFIRFNWSDANETTKRTLPIKLIFTRIKAMWYIEVEEEPWFTLTLTVQTIVGYSLMTILTGIETVSPFLIMMACGYLRILQIRLLSISQISSNNNRTTAYYNADKLPVTKIIDCAKFHQRIMCFCGKLERFTRSLFMVQVMCSIYNISLLGIKLLEKDSSKFQYISVLFINFGQFLVCQWIPENLINESEAIADAAYSATLNHGNYERNANKILLFMIMRSQKPVQLTAGGIVHLSLETFEKMSINALSFFTVLRNFSN